MVMGLAAVIALPGPPAPCLRLPAGQARRESTLRTDAGLFLAEPFANEACYRAQKMRGLYT